jgi:hypothetical protein
VVPNGSEEPTVSIFRVELKAEDGGGTSLRNVGSLVGSYQFLRNVGIAIHKLALGIFTAIGTSNLLSHSFQKVQVIHVGVIMN